MNEVNRAVLAGLRIQSHCGEPFDDAFGASPQNHRFDLEPESFARTSCSCRIVPSFGGERRLDAGFETLRRALHE